MGIACYGLSTVGPYLEHYSGIQVRDLGGQTGYYIPYIYVTTHDAALASGREVLGSPKSWHIRMTWEDGLIQGTLERPAGKRLLTIHAQPNQRSGAGQMYSTRTNFYSVPHLPPLTESGKGAATQLVKWCTDQRFRRDRTGRRSTFYWPGFPNLRPPTHRSRAQFVSRGYSARHVRGV
ncbi:MULTISPECIES: acetoacetate decarboxylase family protein [Bradyrhizobium]|uniref:acetoacetate decarboxylase family protein n=1 Tax=Bradyrhizobium TaxID=374 RepID=UPI001CD7EC4D|nr:MULTISPECIES: acetoacetate decarboxylase family protein [Bradyrhizobium]UWU93611.1 acetoacetate decarboxylase family protein [Bradyrhizobium sp. CB1015]